MSLRSALAGGAAAAALVAALGNPPVVDAARDADNPVFAETVTGFASWDIADGTPGDIVAAIVIRLVVAVVVAGLLCAVAGRSRSRGAAFLGGWGALVVAAGIGGAASYAYLMAVPLDGQTSQQSYLDGLVTAVDNGSAFGLWTGWLVGIAVALVTRPVAAPTPLPAPMAGAGVATMARGVGAVRTRGTEEPPPPWWAPTSAGPGDHGVRPGPSVFAPDERAHGARAAGRPLPPPPAPPPSDPDATVASGPPAPPPSDPDATVASGPPAPPPSDPDATVASGPPAPPSSDPDATVVSGPPAPDDATRSFAAPGRGEDDADATAAMPADDRDRTEPMRRRGR